jgi:hypothetical protein
MRRPLLLVLAALLLGVFAVAPATAAREQSVKREAALSARLEATGTGAIMLRGRLLAFGLIPGTGKLIVRDFGGDAVVRLGGVALRIPPRTGRLVIRRASGRFYVEGDNVRIDIQGAGLVVSAAGRGRALLSGGGVYRLNERPEANWGLGVVLLQPQREAARRRKAA